MNKLSLLLILGWTISTNISAQSVDTIMERARQNIAAYSPAYAPNPSWQRKGAAVSERVIAQAHGDSVVFNYKGNHYTRFDYNLMEYVPTEYWTPSTTSYVPLHLRSKLPRLNAHDTAYQVPQFDSLSKYSTIEPVNYLSVPLFLVNTVSPTYNPQGSVSHALSVTYDPKHVLVDKYEQTVSYERNKLATLDINTGWPNSTYKRAITYQSDDRIIADHDSINSTPYNPVPMVLTGIATYAYDTLDNWLSCSRIGANASSTLTRINTFYPDGKLHTAKVYRNSQLQYTDSFTYTSGVPGYTGFWEFTYGTNTLFTYQEVCVHINADSLKDSVIVSEFNNTSLTYQRAWKFEYNAQGNPIYKIESDPAASAPSKVTIRWYYEPFDPSLEISNPKQGTLPQIITLSPNPTTGTSTLHYQANMPESPIAVSIANMMGQLVHSETLMPQGTSTDILLAGVLTQGIYHISVRGAGNVDIFKGTFLKQ